MKINGKKKTREKKYIYIYIVIDRDKRISGIIYMHIYISTSIVRYIPLDVLSRSFGSNTYNTKYQQLQRVNVNVNVNVK